MNNINLFPLPGRVAPGKGILAGTRVFHDPKRFKALNIESTETGNL
jgi:hypothetical protein